MPVEAPPGDATDITRPKPTRARRRELVLAFALTYADRAAVHLNLGDFEAALLDYDRAIEFDPTFAPAYANREVAHCDRGDVESARDDWEMARSLTLDSAFRAALEARIASATC